MAKRLFFILAVLAVALLAFRYGVMKSITGNIVLENNISECKNLRSNNAYFLESDIIADDNCFNITGSNVILDGRGHKINFIKAGQGAAISVNGQNFEIRNISISVSTGNGKDGIRIIDSGSGKIDNVDVSVKSDDGYGFYFESADNLNISENNLTVYGAGSRGIGLFECFDNSFYGNNIKTYGERGYGMQLYESENNVFLYERIITFGNYASGFTLDNSMNNVFVLLNITTSDAYALEFGNGDAYQEFFDSSFFSEKNKGIVFEPESYGIINLTNTSLTNYEFSGNKNVSVYKNWYLEMVVYSNTTLMSNINFSFIDRLGGTTRAETDDAGKVFLILPEYVIRLNGTENKNNYSIYFSYGNISKNFFVDLKANYYREMNMDNLSFIEAENKLNFVIISPLARDYSGKSINISVKSNIEASCKYNLNNMNNKTMNPSGNEHFAQETGLMSGKYALSVFCKSGKREVERKLNFSLDSGFTVFAVFPEQGQKLERNETEYAFLVQDTSEIKECYLYVDSMKVKSMSYGLSVSEENRIAYDASEGEHEFYIRCIDSKGRIGETDIISFSVLPKQREEKVKKDIGKAENKESEGLPFYFITFLFVLISILLLVVLWIIFGNRKTEKITYENDSNNLNEENLENFR